jgi:diguanylate cyclase (GGDEF)-like protein
VLTGLLNRRALNEHLAKAIERCEAKSFPVSVLMIDVAAGDELLRSIGQLLRSTLRDSDTAFRCGGDEFVVVLEGSDAAGARALATRLTTLVDGLTKTLKVPAQPRLSIGAATLSELAAPSPDALLEEADKQLYAVKGDRKRGPAPAAARQPSQQPTQPKPPLRKTA